MGAGAAVGRENRIDGPLGCCGAQTNMASKPSRTMNRAEFEAKIGRIGYDFVCANDLRGQVSESRWIKAFGNVDRDGDGYISRQEYEDLFGRGSFGKWDTDSNMRIDKDEWTYIWECANAPPGQAASKYGRQQRKGAKGTMSIGGGGGSDIQRTKSALSRPTSLKTENPFNGSSRSHGVNRLDSSGQQHVFNRSKSVSTGSRKQSTITAS